MKVLFVLKQRNYLATYAGVVRALAARGHRVRLAWPDEDISLPDELSACQGVTAETWDPTRADDWAPLSTAVRRSADYVRYLSRPFTHATKLRARAFEKMLKSISDGTRTPLPGWSEIATEMTEREHERLTTIFRLVERGIPSDASQEAFIVKDRPDVVLASPLIDLGSSQADVIKSARRLGIPSAMVLFSWDNLSTKGQLHVVPDRMFVWNELQRREALDLHGFPMSRTIATGAPRFDQFASLSHKTTREAFCAPLGFSPERPILMYLGSSKFVCAGSELPFIRSWVDEVRRSPNEGLRECNILIRPHPDVKDDDAGPEETVRWDGLGEKGTMRRLAGHERAVIVRTSYRRAQGFYDALVHCAAVVALNTSAALEAAIVGRPAFTILADSDVADGQASTLHFHYLLAEHGGCVTCAASFAEHTQQLAASLSGPDPSDRLRAFARDFVRPGGWDRPASELLADAIVGEFSDVRSEPDTAATSARRA